MHNGICTIKYIFNLPASLFLSSAIFILFHTLLCVSPVKVDNNVYTCILEENDILITSIITNSH